MKPTSRIVYNIQHLATPFILDFQRNIYTQDTKPYYMSASFAGRHVVGLGDSIIVDVFLEVQNQKCSCILYLIDYIAHGLHSLLSNQHLQGHLPKTNFLTSWLRQESGASGWVQVRDPSRASWPAVSDVRN